MVRRASNPPVPCHAGTTMRRRALRKSLACLGLIVAISAGLIGYLVMHVPATYARVELPTGPERRKLSGEFMTGVNEMMETIRNNGDGRWQESFSADQMNSYFEEDFVRAMPFHLPQGVHSPRVRIGAGQFSLAFRYGQGFWS